MVCLNVLLCTGLLCLSLALKLYCSWLQVLKFEFCYYNHIKYYFSRHIAAHWLSAVSWPFCKITCDVLAAGKNQSNRALCEVGLAVLQGNTMQLVTNMPNIEETRVTTKFLTCSKLCCNSSAFCWLHCAALQHRYILQQQPFLWQSQQCFNLSETVALQYSCLKNINKFVKLMTFLVFDTIFKILYTFYLKLHLFH